MTADSSQHPSLWIEHAPVGAWQPLAEDTWADVCVIGAGIAGLSTAYMLAQAHKSVVVLEAGTMGAGETRKTTAHLSNALDDRYTELEKVHGTEVARLAAESHTAAINRIEYIVREEKIDCDFQRVDGYLFVPPGEPTDILERELQAAHRAGLADVTMVERAPLAPFDTGRCLRFPRQGQFHPLKYLAGLARGIDDWGGHIHTGTKVESIETDSQARVITKAGPVVTAGGVVVATNTPINDWVTMHTKQAPYLSYAIGMRIPRGSVTQALYWDTLDPYHYVRTQPYSEGEDVLIVGGEDHKVGQATDQDARWQRLRQWADSRFPIRGPIAQRWCGMVMETLDGLAFIGRNPGDKDYVYIVTGDSGMGMTHGTLAGILLTDLILGRDNPWSRVYDPARKPVAGMAWKEFLLENLNVAKQYVKDWVARGDVASADEVAPGHGALVRHGVGKNAVYRDEAGNLHECSAVCPHLGCLVHWNDAEKTWDCPCHGSRFDPTGKVLHGPAVSPLAPAESEQAAGAR